jgi:hypothetical protein
MRVEITIAIQVLVNIHRINIKDTAVRILLYGLYAHLEGGSLRIPGGGNDLGIVLVTVIDLNITVESRSRLIRPITLRCDGI